MNKLVICSSYTVCIASASLWHYKQAPSTTDPANFIRTHYTMNLEFSAPELTRLSSPSCTTMYSDPRIQRAKLFSTRRQTVGHLTSQSSPTVTSRVIGRADVPSNATPIDLPPNHLELLYANLNASDQRIVNNWKRQIRTCIFCAKDYLEIENLGQWRCAQPASGIVESSYLCDEIS